MSVKQQCDRCRFLTPHGRGESIRGGHTEGFSKVALRWYLSEVHRKSLPQDPDADWDLCWECTLQFREFMGILRPGETKPWFKWEMIAGDGRDKSMDIAKEVTDCVEFE